MHRKLVTTSIEFSSALWLYASGVWTHRHQFVRFGYSFCVIPLSNLFLLFVQPKQAILTSSLPPPRLLPCIASIAFMANPFSRQRWKHWLPYQNKKLQTSITPWQGLKNWCWCWCWLAPPQIESSWLGHLVPKIEIYVKNLKIKF